MSIKSLYVGNIPPSLTSEALADAFASYGGTNVRILEGRGSAIVDVRADKLDSAIEDMHGTSLEGRTLTVNEVHPRPNSSGGRAGGYRADNRSGVGRSTYVDRGSQGSS